jgi:hypothetical protein
VNQFIAYLGRGTVVSGDYRAYIKVYLDGVMEERCIYCHTIAPCVATKCEELHQIWAPKLKERT